MISPYFQSDVEILPATLKFTVRGRIRVKTQQLQDKIPGTPKIWSQTPKNPKAG